MLPVSVGVSLLEHPTTVHEQGVHLFLRINIPDKF